MRHFLKTTLGLVVLVTLAWGIYAGLCAIARHIRSLDSDLSKALIAAAAAVIGSAITVSIGKAYESRAATIKELRAKKAPHLRRDRS
jgi:membrane protein YqaA with SNARE-associated domain